MWTDVFSVLSFTTKRLGKSWRGSMDGAGRFLRAWTPNKLTSDKSRKKNGGKAQVERLRRNSYLDAYDSFISCDTPSQPQIRISSAITTDPFEATLHAVDARTPSNTVALG